MREIRSYAKDIHSILAHTKYSLDYYQREYTWNTKQVSELLDDLNGQFLQFYEKGVERSEVANFGSYFLGSFIVSNDRERGNQRFVVDGQQRLTTLTLLLTHIRSLLSDLDHQAQLADLIFSQSYGVKSFNLDIADRQDCMNAIYDDVPFDADGESESVRNLYARYQDIKEAFPSTDIDLEAVPHFADWLMGHVFMVEITVFEDRDAYTVFEAMNDRGTSLTPSEMLRGYLLSRISDPEARNRASEVWRIRVQDLREISKQEDADAVKAWLRSQYAETVGTRTRGAPPGDFELIGSEFHRWVREKEGPLNLNVSTDFANFIERDFDFYCSWYSILRKASMTFDLEYKYVYYNAQSNFTLQYPVILASLRRGESDEEHRRKIRIVSNYLDILLYRRMWNGHNVDFNAMRNTMNTLMLVLRGASSDKLTDLLYDRLTEKDAETFDNNALFSLHGRNRPQVHRILARITDYISVESGEPSHFLDYFQTGSKRYEIEHIWAYKPEQHEDEFSHPYEFEEYRSRVGGLVLLPRSFNASYGDLPYVEKREYYITQNLLAKSLHEVAYEHNPGFNRFVAESGLQFKPHREFKRLDLDERLLLYRQIANRIWSAELVKDNT